MTHAPATAAPSSAPTVVRAAGLALGYGGREVLRNVSLEIRRGEFWFLLGPNGTGKTTFLRALLGLLPVWRGRLEVHPNGTRKSAIGFVPQRCDLNPSLPTTVEEFVSLGFVGLPPAEKSRRLESALRAVQLEGLNETSYWNLSGGQQQRCLIARALVREPPILLLDEPTTGLDPSSEAALLVLLQEQNRVEGRTILFVTHDLRLARRYATHVALFYGGTATAGPAAQVLTEERLREVFGADAAELDFSLGGHP